MQTIIAKNNKFKTGNYRFVKESTLSLNINTYDVYKVEGELSGAWVQLGIWHSIYLT